MATVATSSSRREGSLNPAAAAIPDGGGSDGSPAGWEGSATTRLPSEQESEKDGPTVGVQSVEATPTESAEGRRRRPREARGDFDGPQSLVLYGDPNQMLGVGLDPFNVITRINAGSQFARPLRAEYDRKPETIVGWRMTRVGHLDVATLDELKAELGNLRQYSVPRCGFYFSDVPRDFDGVWSSAAAGDAAAEAPPDAGATPLPAPRTKRPSSASISVEKVDRARRPSTADADKKNAREESAREAARDASPVSESGSPDACLLGHLRRAHRRQSHDGAAAEAPALEASVLGSPVPTKPRRATLSTPSDAEKAKRAHKARKDAAAIELQTAGWREHGTTDPCCVPPDTVVMVHRRQSSACAIS